MKGNPGHERVVTLTAIAAMVWFLVGTPMQAQIPFNVLYGVNSSDDSLSIVDPTTGQVTLIGPLDPNQLLFTTPIALAVRPSDGKIFVWNNSGTNGPGLVTVDSCTGLGTTVGNSTVVMGALAFSPTGVLFGASGAGYNELATIDPINGSVTPVATINYSLGGLAFNSQGVLYGATYSSSPNRLVRIDPNSGTILQDFPLVPDIGTLGDIVFDPAGILMGTGFDGNLGYILFNIDPASGAVSNIRAISGGFPPQGMAFGPRCVPTAPVIYAATNNGVYRSRDRGDSWTDANSGLGENSVLSLAIDPSVPTTIYAGTFDRVFKSTDGGQTWAQASSGFTDSIVPTLAIDPVTPSTVYAGTATGAYFPGNGVFKTIDGGQNWTAANSGLPGFPTPPNPAIIDVLKIDPSATTTIYAGTNYLGVYKSADAGMSWSPVNTGMGNQLINDIIINPSISSTLYAATMSSGVFKSIDGAASWAGSSTGIADPYVISLAIDPANTNTLYAGTRNQGVFKTLDGGSNWTSVNASLASTGFAIDHLPLMLDPINPETVYAGTIGGIFKSADGGLSWASANNGFPPSTRIYALAIESVGAISQPLNPSGATNVYQFANGLFDFRVTYPLFSPPGKPIYLVVQPILISQEDLNGRVDGTGFEGASLVPYGATGNYGILFRATCEYSDHSPATCPEPGGTYTVKTGWEPTGQILVSPAFLKAEVGTNDWENIFTAYYEDRIDPTGSGRTCCRYSDFVFVDGGSAMAAIPSPIIAITTPPNGAVYAINQPVLANYDCGMLTNLRVTGCLGTVGLNKPIDTSSLGIKTFEVSATVSSGPTANLKVGYTVVGPSAYSVRMLYDPNKSNKKGSAVPIKIAVVDRDGHNLSNPNMVVTARELVNGSVHLAPVPDSGYANLGYTFRFDPTLDAGGGFIYALSTKPREITGGTWTLYFEISTGPGNTAPGSATFKVVTK